MPRSVLVFNKCPYFHHYPRLPGPNLCPGPPLSNFPCSFTSPFSLHFQGTGHHWEKSGQELHYELKQKAGRDTTYLWSSAQSPHPTSSWCRLLSCPLPVHLFTHLDLDLLGFPLALALLSHICSWLHLLSNPWLPTSSLQQLFLPLQLCGVYFHTNTDFIAFLSAYFWNFWDSAIASSLYLFL